MPWCEHTRSFNDISFAFLLVFAFGQTSHMRMGIWAGTNGIGEDRRDTAIGHFQCLGICRNLKGTGMGMEMGMVWFCFDGNGDGEGTS